RLTRAPGGPGQHHPPRRRRARAAVRPGARRQPHGPRASRRAHRCGRRGRAARQAPRQDAGRPRQGTRAARERGLRAGRSRRGRGEGTRTGRGARAHREGTELAARDRAEAAPAVSALEAADADAATLARALDTLETVILGKPAQLRLCLACLLARGHLLIEAMEERQVSADGTTYPLPEPFFVVATQNPHEQLGTFALPESQLDRFLMRVTLGYPDSAHERELLRGGERRELLSHVAPALS